MKDEFEEHWNDFIEEYGSGFGRFYNSFKRRKRIAEFFYRSGKFDQLKELMKKQNH